MIVMGGWKKRLVMLQMVSVMSLAGFCASYGAAASEDPYRVSELKAAKESEQLILVVGEEGCRVTVSYYEKEVSSEKKGPGEPAGIWKQRFITEGVYGKNGSTEEKREGDGMTPRGEYNFTMAFGLKEDPGSVLPYHRIEQGDFWVDDSESAYYNKLVNINQTKQSWVSAEDMMASAPYYNYGLVLDYNEDCVPGMGSAIFMHCTKSAADTGSQGCIRIPEELMKQVLQTVDGKCKVIIVPGAEQLEYAE